MTVCEMEMCGPFGDAIVCSRTACVHARYGSSMYMLSMPVTGGTYCLLYHQVDHAGLPHTQHGIAEHSSGVDTYKARTTVNCLSALLKLTIAT